MEPIDNMDKRLPLPGYKMQGERSGVEPAEMIRVVVGEGGRRCRGPSWHVAVPRDARVEAVADAHTLFSPFPCCCRSLLAGAQYAGHSRGTQTRYVYSFSHRMYPDLRL